MRRPWLVLVALAALLLDAAPAAYAQEPTITTDITFPEEGEPFGTFTANEPLCPSGTFVDEFVGLFRSDAIWTTGGGKRLTGRDEISTFTRTVLPGAMKDSTLSFMPVSGVRS